MNGDLLLNLILAVATGAGVYAGIKADLTRAILMAENAQKSADSAEGKIDRHIEHHNMVGQ
ncbi:MAG: hypothetical protein WCZ98_01385 [Sideroxydans sp.]